jgi:hypothetical protein
MFPFQVEHNLEQTCCEMKKAAFTFEWARVLVHTRLSTVMWSGALLSTGAHARGTLFVSLQGIVKVQGAGFSENFVPTNQNEFISQR